MNYMIFYRESDGVFFLFNGEWPIAITPGAPCFGYGKDCDEQIRDTKKHLPQLCAEMLKTHSTKFYIDLDVYWVTKRGWLTTDCEEGHSALHINPQYGQQQNTRHGSSDGATVA